MKQLCTNYTFTPGGAGVGTVALNGINVQLEQVLLITNTTSNAIIYQFNEPTLGGTRSFGGGNTTITLDASTTGQNAADRLQIFYEDGVASLQNLVSFRDTALTSTDVAVKASAGDVYGWNFINPNTVDVYVKFYDATTSSVTVGTTTPVLTILVPAASSGSNGMFFQDVQSGPQFRFSTAITIACVTGIADSSTGAPGTAIHASVRYI